MKKILSLLFSLICFVAYSQTPQLYPTPYQGLGSKNVMVETKGGGIFDSTLVPPTYSDTNSANRQKTSLYPGSLIRVGNVIYQRSSDTTYWILVGGGSSLCPGTQLLSGSITWSGSGLVYDATDLEYYILCLRYSSSATTITLTAANPSFDRIDKFYADNTGNVGVITGTPAANPQEPAVNPLTQIDLGIVYVPAGSLVPAGTTQTIIYNENVEWSGTSDVPSINFAYGTNPYTGSVSTYVPSAPNSSYIEWAGGSDYNFSQAQYLKFWVRLNANFSTEPLSFLDVTFEYTDVTVSQTLAVGNGDFNMDYSLINQWQLVSIPLTGITTYGATFNEVHFVINSAPTSFQLDYVYLLETATIPPVISSGWSLNLNTGTNPTTNGIGTSDSVGVAIKTNSQTRLILPANGIVELSNDELDQQLLTIRNDTIYKTNIPTAYGTLPIVVEVRNDSTFITCPTCDTTGGSGWSLTGNAGTTPGTNFIGTTDAQGLMFKANGLQSGYIDIVNDNTSLGEASLLGVTSGSFNTAVGHFSLRNNTSGNNNVGIGYSPLFDNTTGHSNVGVGYQSFFNNTTGYLNVGIGQQAGSTNETGIANTIIGGQSNVATSSTDSAIAIGFQASAGTKQIAFSPHVIELKTPGITGAGTVGNVLTITSSGISSFQTPSVSSPAGNYGNLQINRNSIFSTPASDSLTFSSATLAVKGALTTTGAVTATGNVTANLGLFSNGVRTGNNTNFYWSSGPAITGNTNDIILKNAAAATAGANVSIGTSAADASAILDVTSTVKGALLPRMTTAQKTAISSPATGLTVYDTDLKMMSTYDGSSWSGYKVLVGNLTQTGTSAPTLTVYENTTGSTYTMGYVSAGAYTMTASSGTPFTSGKTWVSFGAVNLLAASNLTILGYQISSTTQIQFSTHDIGVGGVDEALTNTSIEIRIYP